jgi:hypothetical protein
MFKAMMNQVTLTRRRKSKTYDVCLALERMEERLTPSGGGAAANTWTDANLTGLWSDNLNWSLFHVPTTSEDAVFDGGVYGTSDNCTWASGNPIPQGVFIHNNYGGTLKINFAAEIGTDGLDMEGGSISQSAAGSTLTVDGPFTWTAGTLNSNSVLSTVTLQGGGTITGGSGSLVTGSTLVIPSAVNYNLQGTGLYFNNNAGVTIQSSGRLTWDRLNFDSPAGSLLTSGSGYISNSGTISVSPGHGGSFTSQLPIENGANGSILEVGVSATLNVTGARSGVSVNQSSGSVILDGGTLVASSGLSVSGGQLETSTDSPGFITGSVTVSGSGQILMNTTYNTFAGQLIIRGTLSMEAGFLRVIINPFNNGGYQQIQVIGGDINLGSEAILDIVTLNPNNLQVPGGFDARILSTRATYVIDGDFGTFEGLPFNDGSGGAWTPSEEHNPIGELYHLRS